MLKEGPSCNSEVLSPVTYFPSQASSKDFITSEGKMPPTAEPKGQNQEHLGTFYIETPANICGTYSSSCSRDMFLSQGPRGALDWKQQGQFPEERTSGCVSVGKWELSNERRKLELFSLGKVKTNQAINHYHQQNPTRGGLNQKQSILGRTPTLILGSGVT